MSNLIKLIRAVIGLQFNYYIINFIQVCLVLCPSFDLSFLFSPIDVMSSVIKIQLGYYVYVIIYSYFNFVICFNMSFFEYAIFSNCEECFIHNIVLSCIIIHCFYNNSVV